MGATYQPTQWLIPDNANTDKVGNYSFNFDGTAALIDIGPFALIDNLSQFSISLWYKPNFVNATYRIWGKYDSLNTWIGLQATSTGQIQGIVSNGGLAYSTGAAGELTADTWNHLVLTFDGTEGTPDDRIKMYVDKTETASYTVTGTLPTTTPPTWITNNLWIGKSGYASDLVNGEISEVSIFNYALASEDVTTLYGDATDGVGNPMGLASPPVAYYKGDRAALGAQWAVPNQVSEDYAFDFIEANQTIIETSTVLPTESTFSVSFWVNIDDVTAAETIIDNRDSASDGWGLYTTSSSIYFKLNADTTTYKSIAGENGNWLHVVATYDGSTTNLYINNDGSPATQSISETFNVADNFSIGRRAWDTAAGLDGKISNVVVWDSELTAGNVTTLYNNGTPLTTLADFPASGDVQGWWKLDQSALWNPVYDTWALPPANSTLTQTQAYAFDDGINQYIRNESMIGRSSETEFTFSVWINANTLTGGYGTSPFGTNGSFYNTDDPGGYLRFYLTTTTIYWNHYANGGGTNVVLNHSDSGFAKGGWYNVIGVFESSAWKVFVNGVDYSADISYTGTVPTTMPSLKSGAYINLCIFGTFYPTGSSYDWDGMVGPVAFWNSEQSANVATIYNGGVPGDLSSLSPNNWWKLDGNATDSGSAGNNGTLTLDPAVVSTPIIASPPIGTSSGMTQASLVPTTIARSGTLYSNYSFDFDGVDDLFTMGDVLGFDYDDPFSISLWMNDIGSGTYALVSKQEDAAGYRGYNFYIDGTGGTAYLKFSLVYDNSPSTMIIVRGTTNLIGIGWSNLIVTYDGSGNASGVKMYINSTLDALDPGETVDTLGSNTTLSAAAFNIGARDGGSLDIDAQLTQTSIFDYELSATNVLSIYNNGRPGDLTSLSPVSWWRMGEDAFASVAAPTAWTIPDQIGSNDGTSAGNPDLVGDAPDSNANGLSVSMDIYDRIGESGFSDLNALSYNMPEDTRKAY